MSENEIVHKRCPLNPSLPTAFVVEHRTWMEGLGRRSYGVSPCELPDDQHPNTDNMANG